MLRKVSIVLLVRVKNFVLLEELAQPFSVIVKASNSMMLLEEWQHSFHKTKMEIETSERERRWEFATQEIFMPIRHAKRICQDMIAIAMNIASLNMCFSEKFEIATRERTIIQDARAKVSRLVDTFPGLTFDIFSRAVFHQWENHLNWFKRENRFLEVEITSQSEKMFAHLNSAMVAAEAMISLISQTRDLNSQYLKLSLPPQRQQLAIQDSFVSNVPMIVDKFVTEMKDQREKFLDLSGSSSPPIAHPEMPPISGTICWADGILMQLDETLGVMKSIEKLVQKFESAGKEDDYGKQEDFGKDKTFISGEVKFGETTARGSKHCAESIIQRRKWEQATHIYNEIRRELFEYKQRQYQGIERNC